MAHTHDAVDTHEERQAAFGLEVRAKYTQEQVDALGAKGHAFGPDADGHYSYPIDDLEDLRNAIHAVGRGNADHDAIRKYVIKMAGTLSATDQIPDNWNLDGSLKTDDAKSGSAADPCNRCNGDKTVSLGGKDVECPQCGGSGSGDKNAESKTANFELMRRTGLKVDPELRAIRDGMHGLREERRMPTQGFDLREVPDGSGGSHLICTGYASVTCADKLDDSNAYEMEDMWGPYVESTVRGFANKSIQQNCDTNFLVNHGSGGGLSMARTKPGTLKLTEDLNGLHYEAKLNPKRPDVQILRMAVEDRAIDESSFAFRVLRQEWNSDYTHRWITEVSLDKGDVSPVNFGAAPNTANFPLALRSALWAVDLDQVRMVGRALKQSCPRDVAALEQREGKILSADNKAAVQAAIDHLHAADDADMTGIVRSLQDINSALDGAMAALAGMSGLANPDGDPNDLQPTLTPPEQKARLRPSALPSVQLALAKAKAA